jgi:acyl-coenzyme A synthetase/AMP-(fatty) acid ligase
MFMEFLKDVFLEKADAVAIVWHGRPYQYVWLSRALEYWVGRLTSAGIRSGDVVLLQGDFTPNSVAVLLALVEKGCIAVPLSAERVHEREALSSIAMANWTIAIDEEDSVSINQRQVQSSHELYELLRQKGHPGIVFFTSGSTGVSKGVVHDLARLLVKYQTRRHDLRTLAFLLFDHIGGFDTLLYVLSNGSTLVVPDFRLPGQVCQAIAQHQVQVLPVSPSFLNLMLLSEAHAEFDLRSLRYITYGAEVMPASTLRKCAAVFPGVTLLQKYGATEIGTMRSKSEKQDSLWVKIGGEGYAWRVVDGILQVKCDSAMVGYLNAPSPFTSDGWFITGDVVEQNGDSLRILGRKSDIINVGGQKVYPAEVEEVICELDGVADVTVYGEKNQLLGSIVCAKVRLARPEPVEQFSRRLRMHCKDRLEKYKVPLRVTLSDDLQFDARSKKMRRDLAERAGVRNGRGAV